MFNFRAAKVLFCSIGLFAERWNLSYDVTEWQKRTIKTMAPYCRSKQTARCVSLCLQSCFQVPYFACVACVALDGNPALNVCTSRANCYLAQPCDSYCDVSNDVSDDIDLSTVNIVRRRSVEISWKTSEWSQTSSELNTDPILSTTSYEILVILCEKCTSVCYCVTAIQHAYWSRVFSCAEWACHSDLYFAVLRVHPWAKQRPNVTVSSICVHDYWQMIFEKKKAVHCSLSYAALPVPLYVRMYVCMEFVPTINNTVTKRFASRVSEFSYYCWHIY